MIRQRLPVGFQSRPNYVFAVCCSIHDFLVLTLAFNGGILIKDGGISITVDRCFNHGHRCFNHGHRCSNHGSSLFQSRFIVVSITVHRCSNHG